MKRIKSSFIGKAFFSLILIYFIVFLFMFVFQEAFFRTFYTSRTVRTVRSEITELTEKENYQSPEIEELLFSRNTQTITSIIPLSDIYTDNQFDLYVLEVESGSTTYNVYAPKVDDFTYEAGSDIDLISFQDTTDDIYPLYLKVDDQTLIRSNIEGETKSDLLSVDYDNQTQISGTIISISNNYTTETAQINSVVSTELLNIMAKNYRAIIDFEDGYYYFSNKDDIEHSNLVFFTEVNINGTPSILISVYEMSHIDDIVRAAATVNLYMFIVVLIVLFIASFIYSREFSKPLVYINNQTKKLSNLDFEDSLIKIDSTDEFAELSSNINLLSINLKTTLDRLNDQNKQLLNNLEKESKNEQRRRDFVSGMSHELKTPLAVIQASAEAMDNGIYETKEEIDQALKLIQSEVAKTNRMIKSMMNIYQIDTTENANDYKLVNVKTLIENIDHSLNPLYSSLSLNVSIEVEEAHILCDQDQIEMVLVNLFTNAIKYTPRGEDIYISILPNGNEIEFKFTNYGTSIKHEDIEKIFDPFYRIDKARSRVEGSTGLGLYIVAQTLERYNSKCEVISSNNSVQFTFKLEKVINPE